MHIMLLFSIIPDLDAVPTDQLTIRQGDVHIPFPHAIFDPFCESAAELTLQLRDQLRAIGQEPVLQACTIGNASVDRFCQEFFAHGFSDVFRIDTTLPPYADPADTAAMLTRELNPYLHSDTLILMGQWGGLWNNAQLPARLAAALGRTYYGEVIHCVPTETALSVTCQIDGGHLVCSSPANSVLSVGNCPHSYLRSPTLQARLLSQGRTVQVLPVAPSPQVTPFLPREIHVVHAERTAALLEGQTLDEQVQSLLALFPDQKSPTSPFLTDCEV